MTPRERILAVYRGEKPDVVPFMLDLSHWFYQKNRIPWDISVSYEKPELELIDYHRRAGVGFYMPNLASIFSTQFPSEVRNEMFKATRGGEPEITWRVTTPVGSIERTRVWEPQTYAWGISRWGIKTEQDLRVFQYAMERRTFVPRWDRYKAWVDAVGDLGIVYLLPGYSAMGYLLNYWMGIEQTMYATVDFPETLREVIDAVNRNELALIDMLCEAPGEVVCLGDNFSSDIQPPSFFNTWSRAYYTEAVRRLHAAGKYVAVHIDGKLKGAITMIRNAGADCADAVTPKPMGDLTAAECREEAGDRFILSGGVSPDLWLPNVPQDVFERHVRAWMVQKKTTFRFMANAGDQVPPGAVEGRIKRMKEIVESEGRL